MRWKVRGENGELPRQRHGRRQRRQARSHMDVDEWEQAFAAEPVRGAARLAQQRGAYFSLDPQHPNRLEPGKIPMHTLIASMAKRNDRLWSVLGCMGADGQPQIHLQLHTAMIDFGLDIQQAIELPRFLSGRFGLGGPRDTLHMEARFAPGTVHALRDRGHHVSLWGPWNDMAGHAHGIVIDGESGMLAGGSDPRSDGAAVGY
jgi:gamma-glutamyltranspeptidase/glutathione hydrolase